jgi:hypothetical protein
VTHAEAPVSVTFKTGTAQYAPQITVRGNTVDEVITSLVELNPDITEAGDLNAADLVAAFGVAVVSRWATAVKALDGVVPTASNPQPSGGAAAESGGQLVELDRFNNTYEHNHPKAPATPHGPAVLKRWKQRDGKARTSWVDPRVAPSGFAVHGTINESDLWEGKWGQDAKGV